MQLFDRNVHKNHRGFDLHIQRPVSAVTLGLLLFPVCAFSQITVNPARNALVPTTAPILPPQAFVDAMPVFANPSTSLNVSNKNITSITDALLRQWAAAANLFTKFGGNFSGNNLDSSTVARILALWDDSGAWDALSNPSDDLDISGGTSAEVSYQSEFFLMQIPSPLPGNNTIWDLNYNGDDYKLAFSTSTVIASSYVESDTSSDQSIVIGISGSPSQSAVASKIIALHSTLVNKRGWQVSAGGADQVKILQPSPLAWTDIEVTQNDAGLIEVQHQVGSADAALTDILNNNRRVKINAGGSVVTLTP